MKSKVNRSIDALSKHLDALHNESKPGKMERAPQKLSNDISAIHRILYGDVDNDRPNIENATKTVQRMMNKDLFLKLIENLKYLEFDAKKQVSDILNYIIRRCQQNKFYQDLNDKTNKRNGYNPIINALLTEYDQNKAAILYEMVRRKEMTKILLFDIKCYDYYRSDHHYSHSNTSNISSTTCPSSPSSTSTSMSIDSPSDGSLNTSCSTSTVVTEYDLVEKLIILSQDPCFNIASNAYKTLHHLLIHGHPSIVTKYLLINHEKLTKNINKLIKNDENGFFIQKQYLLLLRDILTNKGNYNMMIKYVSNKDNLAIIMTLMKKYKESSISIEAYNIFKIFVANPKKERNVQIILWKNKQKLLNLLSKFHNKLADKNEAFSNERSILMQCLNDISLPNDLQSRLSLLSRK